MLDSDGLVEGWASIACDPKVAGRASADFFFNYYIGKIKWKNIQKTKNMQ